MSKSTEVKAASGDDYIERIRKKLNENSSARTEREKRRRKVLVEQMQAHWEMEVLTYLATLHTMLISV